MFSCGGTGITLDQGVGDLARISCVENQIINVAGNGIDAEATDCLISENLVYNPGSNGIVLASIQRRALVVSNRVIGAGISGIVAVSGGATYQIHGNIVKEVGSFGISCSGTNASVKDNLIENTGNDGIDINTNTNALVSNNSIINSDGTAAITVNGGAGSIDGNYINTTQLGTRGIWCFNASDETRIANNTIVGVDSAGIRLDSNAVELLITANRITGGNGLGININEQVARCLITSNTILSCTNDGIRALAGTNNMSYLSIANNLCQGNSGDGIRLGGVTECSIIGNICTGNTGNGLEFADSGSFLGDFCSVVHNILRGNTGAGFNNTATGGSNNITGNIT